MIEKWPNHHLLLLASLIAASSAGSAKTRVGQNEQPTFLSKSKKLMQRIMHRMPWSMACIYPIYTPDFYSI